LTNLEQRLVAMELELEERLIRREQNLRRFLEHLYSRSRLRRKERSLTSLVGDR
jgi:hypothetical protein